MEKPVILLAFANDGEPYLTALKNESRETYRYLNFSNGKEVEVKRIEGVNIEKLYEEITPILNRICIFHYAGHANGTLLDFGETKAYAKGISQLLGEAPNLKLVFLNGCATQDQVDLLHKNNVKAVIATSISINDNMAAKFAIYFYAALSQFFTIASAFKYAKSLIDSISNGKYPFTGEFLRHLKTEDIKTNDGKNEVPWGIYYNTSNNDDELINEVLNWKIPDNYIPTVLDDYEMNKKLVELIAQKGISVLNEITEGEKSKVRQLVELEVYFKDYKNNINPEEAFREMELRIVNILPYPIGIQLRRMIAVERSNKNEIDKYFDLLNRQVFLYDTLVKFGCFTMLACFWDLLDKYKKLENSESRLKITEQQLAYIKKLITLSKEEKLHFDYTYLIKLLQEVLEANDAEPFISEFKIYKNSIEAQNEFHDSHLFIDGVKIQLSEGRIDKNNCMTLCKRTEDALCEIFEKLSFILKYKLVGIRNIEIIKFRYPDKTLYQHKRVVLDKADSGFEEAEYSYSYCTDSYSVILVKDIDSFSPYLTLSPFIIDENGLIGSGNSSLKFFSHNSNDDFVFQPIEDNDKEIKLTDKTFNSIEGVKTKDVTKANRRFTEINKQLRDFKESVYKLQPVQQPTNETPNNF